jgi:calcium-dependent protein kinase
MGAIFCDCEKKNQNSKENIPISKESNIIIKPLSSIPSKIISKESSIIKTPRSNIEEHISIDKTTLIGKGEGDIRDTYEIGKKIGGGSFGLVFLSVNKRTGEKVAIKAMRKFKKDNRTLNNDLLKEVEMLKTLDHQNILNIFEFYEGTYNFYIVTEYCQSGNLLDKITKGNYLMSESRAAVILFQILSAINYCHQRKIIHRDLKPENIMLDNTSKNGYPYIKIIDFGTAKFIGDEYENQLIGSPYYMVPVVFEKNILINAIFGQLELFYILLFLKESLLKIFLIVQKKMKLI